MLLFIVVSVCVRLGRVTVEVKRRRPATFSYVFFILLRPCALRLRTTDTHGETEGRERESEAGLPPVSVTAVVVFPPTATTDERCE